MPLRNQDGMSSQHSTDMAITAKFANTNQTDVTPSQVSFNYEQKLEEERHRVKMEMQKQFFQ